MNENPLLQTWTGIHALPPFDQIDDNQFPNAFETAFADGLAEIDRIAGNPESPTYANTIERMENADQSLDRVASMFFNLAAADSNEERRRIETEYTPRLAEHATKIVMNAALFRRINALWEQRSSLDLTDEQLRVLELYREDFVRGGAALTADDQKRFGAIRARLAALQTEFSQNILADECDWSLPIPPAALEGLPDTLQNGMQQLAKDKGIHGHAISLSRSLIVPFLQYCPDRELRKTAYLAWVGRGANDNENNNLAIVDEILALRRELANLLGYRDYADYKLENTMAGTAAAVESLLDDVWQPARQQAEADAGALRTLMAEDGVNADLEPWDWRYYAEKLRQIRHDYQEAKVRAYFGLDAMIGAIFDCAERLFSLEFTPVETSLYHPDCRCWEVTRDGRHLALFIGDYHARSGKQSGAWCSTFRDQKRLGGAESPIVVNVCNFNPPDENGHCLLSFDDVRTLFHEFGHALHAMLSDVTYPRISGTRVARDFVELPSQLFEHWMEQKDVLMKHARHIRTGQAINAALLDRILAARNFDQGFATVEYLASALVDLRLHTTGETASAMELQNSILTEIGMPGPIRMRHAVPHFQHVFAGDGYSAGYYSYIWSEVLDADAFKAFEEAGGPFCATTAARLERTILSQGGSGRPEDLYRNFRGRLPSVDALLSKRGLVPT
ncbi:MAG: M3 family metallopeptidase [Rhodobacteraceae bacterium]|nr:M3 family metallopeptidase [Paracoccaceae bacterium]